MADPTYIELVRFSAEGIEEIEEQTKSLEDAIKSALARQEAMAKLLKDPAYREAAKEVEKLAEANRNALKPAVVELTRIEKERQALVERGSALRSGAYRKEQAELVALGKEASKLAAVERRDRLKSGQTLRSTRMAMGDKLTNDRLALRERREVLSSGLYAKNAAASGRLRYDAARTGLDERRALLASGHYGAEVGRRESLKQAEKTLANAERKVELQTLNGGRVGGALYAAERARPGMLAVGAAGGAVLAAGRSGFSGTVNQNAFDMELKLINREIANALVPALREVTSGLRWFRRGLERLGPGGQKVLAGGAIAAAGVGTAAVGAAGIGHLLNGLRGAGIIGRGAAAGGMLASQAAVTAAGTAAGNVAGSVAGNVAGGVAGGTAAGTAAGGVSRFAKYGKVAGKLGAVGAAAASIYDQVSDVDESGWSMKSLIRNGPVRGADFLFGGEAARLAGYKSGSVVGQSFDAVFGNDRKASTGGGSKSQALIADAGTESFDSAYNRVQSAVSLMDAQNAETKAQVAGATPSPGGTSTFGGSLADEWVNQVVPLLQEQVRLMQQQVNNNPRALE